MRVWDVNPGYLNRQSLLGEHREIHALFVILAQGGQGYAKHPETARWRGHLGALAMRHDLVVAEMALRGYRHRSPAPQSATAEDWPESFVDSPADQFARLLGKYRGREEGRIPLPLTAQELWAQHKYSVLARDPKAYREIGARLARLGRTSGVERLSEELAKFLRSTPSPGGIRNAVEHLWGYVSGFASPEERAALEAALRDEPVGVLFLIHRLAVQFQVSYVLGSTALSDLAAALSREGRPISPARTRPEPETRRRGSPKR